MLNRLFVALAIVVVLACSNSGHAALVTFTLNITETAPGSGVFTLLANSSLGDNAGLASYGVELTGGVSSVDHTSPNAIASDGRNVGFRVVRTLDNDPTLSASQDTFVPGYINYGVGQTADGLSSTLPAGISLFPVTVEAEFYDAPVELANGTWLGVLPGINTAGATGANVFASAGGLTTFAAGIGTNVNFNAIPEPSVFAMMGLALGCVAWGRCRRRNQVKA